MDKQVKEWIEHLIDVEFYGNALFDELRELYVNFFDILWEKAEGLTYITSKKKYNEFLTSVYHELEAMDYALMRRLEEEEQLLIEKEIKFLKKIDKDRFGNLSYKNINSKTSFMPISIYANKEDLVKNISKIIKDAVEKNLRVSYVTYKPAFVSDSFKNLQSKVEKQLKTSVKEFEAATVRNIDTVAFVQNDVEVVYCATLDGNTCIECASRNGLVYKSKEAPVLPLHLRCRCSLAPLSVFNERPPTFSEWLSAEDESVQKEVLGKTRYEMYKKGMSVDRFTDNGKLVLLKDIKDT